MRLTLASAINKPKVFVGIERRMLVVCFVLSLLVGVAGDTFWHSFAAILLFLALCSVSVYYTRKDDRVLKILLSIRKQRALYDCGKWSKEGGC